MLKPRRPSPALIVACVALAVALSGVGYAATLAKNSVGSAQVKPNSLTGGDIKESTLKGVVLGTGTARAGNKVLGTGAPYATAYTIPGTGRFEMDCGAGPTSTMRFRNTTGSDAFVWLQRDDESTNAFFITAPGDADATAFSTITDQGFSFWLIRTAGPAGPLTQVQVATYNSGSECFAQFVSQRVTH
jgi:hypothetical protein